jgi:hypothetical protein
MLKLLQKHKQLKPFRHNYLRAFSQAYLIMACVTLFFAGCSKPETVVQATRLGHARHFDIPQPVGFTFQPKCTNADGDYFICSGNLSLAKTIEFYMREMESNGWELANFSNAFEGLIVCSKPHKLATISLRYSQQDQKTSTQVHIFVRHQRV